MLAEAIKVLQDQIQLATCETDWGYESVLLERSELDKDMVSEGYQQGLPKMVMVHTYIYQDMETTEYVVYFITDENSQHEYIRGLLKNGKFLWPNINGNYK